MPTDFDLDAPATNNYANMILQEIKTYNNVAKQRYHPGYLNDGISALKNVFNIMPPKGKEYILNELKTQKFIDIETYHKIDKTGTDNAWDTLDGYLDKMMNWIWPNILEIHINTGKPAYTTQAHLGNQPRT